MGWFCRTASQALQNLASVTTDTLPVFLPFHSPFPPSKQCRWVSSLIACFASRCASRGILSQHSQRTQVGNAIAANIANNGSIPLYVLGCAFDLACTHQRFCRAPERPFRCHNKDVGAAFQLLEGI